MYQFLDDAQIHIEFYCLIIKLYKKSLSKIINLSQGWQRGGKYSYFPGRREILAIPGNYWEIGPSPSTKLKIYFITKAITMYAKQKIN